MRQCEVLRALHGAQDDEIRTLIAAMFMGFPTLKMGPEDARKTAAVYVSQLREFPAWAIKAGCERILQDKISGRSSDFAPSIATLVGVVREQVKDLQSEGIKLKALLAADVYRAPTDEERAAVKAKFDELLAELRLNEPFQKSASLNTPLDPAAVEARLTAERDTLPPAMPGPLLCAALGLRTASAEAAE